MGTPDDGISRDWTDGRSDTRGGGRPRTRGDGLPGRDVGCLRGLSPRPLEPVAVDGLGGRAAGQV